MRVAVVGGGISGLAAAYGCQTFSDVALYEAQPRLGGHTDTHNLLVDGRTYAIDSGFIVFNKQNYPRFSQWLDDLGVSSQATEMTFGVTTASGLEYGTSGPGAVFCQRRNALSPSFLCMLNDIRRFYRAAQYVGDRDTRTLGEFLRAGRYSEAFAENHLLPMSAALWSAPRESARNLPIGHVAVFMAHHGLTRWRKRPQWRVVRGGSSSYLSAFSESFTGETRLACRVRRVIRQPSGVTIDSETGSEHFDQVVFACHSDDALALIDATPEERRVLSAIPYQSNRVVLHSDTSVMPSDTRAWSSWNVHVTQDGHYEFTYWMNRLQGLASTPHFFVTLNPLRSLSNLWAEREYRHPVFTPDAAQAKRRLLQVNGKARTHYCGAWCGWGFHEDGFASGAQAAERLRSLVEK